MFTIKPKLSKHDQHLETLSKRVENNYDFVLKEVPIYSKRRRLVGEIDMIGVKNDYCDLFEVKCSHRITKAKMQLRKYKKVIRGKRVRKTYFFCGDSGQLLII